jgi:hypothetical protein
MCCVQVFRSSMYRSLRTSPDAHAVGTCSEYLNTTHQVAQWQEHINAMTTLLRSLEQDSSIDDSCTQICDRVVRKLKEATDIVKAVAPSEELTRQLDDYVNSQCHQVKLLYRLIHTALQALVVQFRSTSTHYTSIQKLLKSVSMHYTSIQKLLKSVSISRTWKATWKRAGSTNDNASVDISRCIV